MEKLLESEEKARFDEMDMEYEKVKGEAIDAEHAYLAAKNVVDGMKKQMEESKEKILRFAAQGIVFDSIDVKHSTRKGNVDMKALQRKFNIMDSDVDECRKATIDVNSITLKK